MPPGGTYYEHEYSYKNVLHCVHGRIAFHTGGGGADLGPGDRLMLPPHTPRAATVGAEGVRCIEASR